MAHYRATIETRQSRDDVFFHLSDFSAAPEWDPGTISAARLGGTASGAAR